MLIEDYDLNVFTPPCMPDTECFAAIARLKTDISEVLPYLNATLCGVVYHPEAKALTWKKVDHSITFSAYEIASSNAVDRAGAEKEIKEVVGLVNHTWERRAEITPNTVTRKRPTPMAVYKLLPGTNCKLCGEATCWVFAARLVTSQKKLAECPLIYEAQYADKLSALEEIIL